MTVILILVIIFFENGQKKVSKKIQKKRKLKGRKTVQNTGKKRQKKQGGLREERVQKIDECGGGKQRRYQHWLYTDNQGKVWELHDGNRIGNSSSV